jgi:hypothetical protein
MSNKIRVDLDEADVKEIVNGLGCSDSEGLAIDYGCNSSLRKMLVAKAERKWPESDIKSY